MAQRVLVKLDVLKRYEKKKLSKYDIVECQNLEKIQLKPYHRTPLTFDFKLFYEPTTKKSNIPAIPSIHNSYVAVKEESSAALPESSSKSALSTHFSKNNYSGKSATRPSSAPSYLKANLKTADGSFLILKQKLKQKTASSTSEVQKIPESLSDRNLLPARTCISQDGETSIREREDDIVNQSATNIYAEARREPTQDLGMENKFIVGTSDHLRSAGQDERKANLPKDYLINDGQNIQAGFIHDNKSVLKKKEIPLLPLSIMDELENPNVKTISAGCVKVESQNQMKMSESFPTISHESSRWDFAWNQWLLLYGKKTLDYLNQDNEACMDLNPVLQNNYDDSIAIIRNKTLLRSSLRAKRKKKSTRKPKRITIQILSLERQLSNLSLNSQKGTSLVQKTHGHFTKTITKHVVTEKNILQNMSQRNKDILMADGKNPIGNTESTLSTVSRIKSSLAEFLKKPLTKSKGRFKKSNAIVNYIPCPKPIPVYEAPGGLADCKMPLSVDSSLRKPPSDKLSADRSSSDQDPFLNESTTTDMDFKAQDLDSSGRKSEETSSETSKRAFLLDVITESPESESSENVATYSKDESSEDSSTAVSIPIALSDTSESSCLSRPETRNSGSGKTA